MSKKLNPVETGVDFQQVIRPHPSPDHHVVIINSVELNILIGGRKMKLLIILLTLALTAGCASKKDVEVTMIRVRPIELAVEVLSATPKFDSAPDRYMLEVRVLEPDGKKDAALHLLVDGLGDDRRAFIVPGSHWIISCDEEAFDHERSIGFSFWAFGDLRPKEAPISEGSAAP
jgi:hypothetical protein